MGCFADVFIFRHFSLQRKQPGGGGVLVASIQITGKPASNKLVIADTKTLGYTSQPADSDSFTVTWSSSDPTVATIGQDGKVTALTAGSTSIKVTVNNSSPEVSDSFVLTVEPEPIPATAVTITGAGAKLYSGGTGITLGVTFEPADSTDDVVWSSTKPSVASINAATGVVTPLTTGVTTIRASVIGNTSVYDEVSITVYPNTVDGAYIEDFSSLTVHTTPAKTGTPPRGSEYLKTFESEILEGYTDKGTLSWTKGDGTFIIDGTDNTGWDRTYFTPKMDGIFDPAKKYSAIVKVKLLEAGNLENIKQTNFGLGWYKSGYGGDAGYNAYRFTAIGETINMVINITNPWTALSIGSWQLNSQLPAKSTYKLEISEIKFIEFTAVEGFSLVNEGNVSEIRTDNTAGVQLGYDWTNKDGDGAASEFTVEWSSSDTSIATVTQSGKVMPVGGRSSAGSVTITARVDGQSAHTRFNSFNSAGYGDSVRPEVQDTATFTVEFVDVDTLTIIDKDDSDAEVGSQYIFDIKDKASEAWKLDFGYTVTGVSSAAPCPFTVTWSSSNSNIAAVDADGKITIKGVGTVIIKVVIDGQIPEKSKSVTLVIKNSDLPEVIDSITIKKDGYDISGTTINVRLGDTVTLTYEVAYADGEKDFYVTWESGDTNYITIPDGNEKEEEITLELKALTPNGDPAMIEIKVDGESASMYIYINVLPPLVRSVEFKDTENNTIFDGDEVLELKYGEDFDFVVVTDPVNCEEFTITWTYTDGEETPTDVTGVVRIDKTANGYRLIVLGDGSVTVTGTIPGTKTADGEPIVVTIKILVNGTKYPTNGIYTETYSAGKLTVETDVNDRNYSLYSGDYFKIGGKNGSTNPISNLSLTDSKIGFTFGNLVDQHTRLSFWFHSYDKDADTNDYIVRIPLTLTAMSNDSADNLSKLRVVYGQRQKDAELGYNKSNATGSDSAAASADWARFTEIGETVIVEIRVNKANWNGETYIQAGAGQGATGTATFAMGEISIVNLSEYNAAYDGNDMMETFETGTVTTTTNANSITNFGTGVKIYSANSDALAFVTPASLTVTPEYSTGRTMRWTTARVYRKGLATNDEGASIAHSKLEVWFPAEKIINTEGYIVNIPIMLEAIGGTPAANLSDTYLEFAYNNGSNDVNLAESTISFSYLKHKQTAVLIIPANSDWNGKIAIRIFNDTVTASAANSKHQIQFDNITVNKAV